MERKPFLDNGTVFESNNCGPMKIMESVPDRYRYYIVRFLNTGSDVQAREDAILAGTVRDPYAPLKCGIACTGNIGTKGKYKPYYTIWQCMINRCYNPKDKRHLSYQNVTVCERWLTFEYFYQDCREIEGFDEKKFKRHEIVLDKDKKQRFSRHKVYSKETCTWIPAVENVKMQDTQMKAFEAISPDGERIIASNITDFARTHSLSRGTIQNILHGRTKKSAIGWQFRYIDTNCEEIV